MEEAAYQFAVSTDVYFVEHSTPMKGVVVKVFITEDGTSEVNYKVSANGGEYIIPEAGLFTSAQALTEHLNAAISNVDSNNETTEE